MHLLNIFLQANDVALPTNIWTVGGALGLFAGVIIYLFKLYNDSQEKRMSEMKSGFDGQMLQVRKDLDEEKMQRRALQEKFDTQVLGQFAKNQNTLEKVEDLLEELKRKP